MLTTGVSQTLPGLVTPGARMIIGSRTPPSYSQPLPERNGRLLVGPGLRSVQRPPLSEKKQTTVFSASPRRSTAASTCPTLSSTAATIEA